MVCLWTLLLNFSDQNKFQAQDTQGRRATAEVLVTPAPAASYGCTHTDSGWNSLGLSTHITGQHTQGNGLGPP